MNRKRVLTFAVVALVAAATVGGVAYATIPDPDDVYSACMLKNVGTIRLIDPSLSASLLMSHCTSFEQPISWNGQGVSPTVAQLAAGGANCPAGGASITDRAGNTAYVCNGTNGTNGTNGRDGEDFAGTFTIPNGTYTLSVADTGITLQGPAGRIKLTPTEAEVRGNANLSLLAAPARRTGKTPDMSGVLPQSMRNRPSPVAAPWGESGSGLAFAQDDSAPQGRSV